MMRRYRSTIRFAWLWLGVLAIGLSARAEDSGSPFIVNALGNEEGLPQSSVIAVIQARDGYLWLGTLNGLVRFDGNQFTVFNQMNTPGLPGDRVIFLFEDSRTNLWIATETAGLSRIRDGIVKTFPETARSGKVACAQESPSGDVLFATESGILTVHGDHVDFMPGVVSPQLSGEADHTVVPSKTGGLWQLPKAGGAVRKLTKSQVEKDLGPPPWGNAAVTAAFEDDRGDLVVGTHGAGVFWSANGRWQNISTGQGLSSSIILSLCLDREGNLWAGTDGGGLDRIRRKLFNSPADLPARDAQSLSADADGGFWTAFNAGGLSHWNENGTAENFAIGQASNAWSVLVTRQQLVWAGGRFEGLFQLDGGRFIPAPGAEVLGQQIFALFEDHHGGLWAGSSRGLGNFDGQRWKVFNRRDGLPENSVRAIAQDQSGTLWAGTESRGLVRLNDGKFSPQPAPADDISCLYADKDGGLWVGTFGHGLARLKEGRWETFSTRHGLASDSISYLFEDDGYLWIGSNAGLMRVQKRSLDDLAAGRTNSILCRTYGKVDGLPTRECSIGSQPSACRTADGKLWFATTKGVACLSPADLKPNLQPPTVMIESVLVDGHQQKSNRLTSAWPSSVTVAPGGDQSKVQLEIHYTALDFSAPQQVRFRYQLEGYQSDWTDAGNERVARYPKLPPGHYHFNVIAFNEDGVPNQESRLLEVVVLPQFWQTTWFRIAAVVFILAFTVAVVRYISTQKLQRQLQGHRQREALERERGRIARDLHDQLGANLTQVALLGEMAEADKHVPDEVEGHAQQISQTARETTRSLDEIVWAINPANDTLEGLANYCFKYAQEFCALAGIRCRGDAPSEMPHASIPPDVRHNVFLAFKEAVNNVVKHAGATEARIRLRTRDAALKTGIFLLEIEDNGKGVTDLAAKQHRSGMRNMRKRMEDIGGSFEIGPAPDKGTIVRLIVPIS